MREKCPEAPRIPTAQRFAEPIPHIARILFEILRPGEDEPWNIDAGLDTDPDWELAYGVAMILLQSLSYFGEVVGRALADDPLTLRLSLFRWVATYNGGLLLYLFSWCAERNPRELADLIIKGFRVFGSKNQ